MSNVFESLNLDRRLRSSPHYELVAFDRLRSNEQAYLYHLGKNPDLYGILRPRNRRRLHVQTVGKLVARLLTALERPAPLPSFAAAAWGPRTRDRVSQLVLDGVLEIEHNGTFISGVAAHPVLITPIDWISGDRSLDTLSLNALRYAESLHMLEPALLSKRLYRYNTLPASPRWRRRFPNAHAVCEFLELDQHLMNAALIDVGAESQTRRDSATSWMQWNATASTIARQQPKYKLYLSPSVESVRDAFHAIITEFGYGKLLSFKVGHGLNGILRPDKLVMYFAAFEDLEQSAARLARHLGTVRAQGVPFTAKLDDRGLVSWGTDPPRDQQLFGWSGGESWRLWITNRLATAIAAVHRAGSRVVSPIQFALDRLRLEGVELTTWIPRPVGTSSP